MTKITSAIAILTLFLLAVSCKKFDHNVPYPAQACELCDFADSITGTYHGYSSGPDAPYYQSCQLSVTFEHIFLNLNSPLDSTTMYFRKTSVYHLTPEIIEVDTIAMLDTSGTVLDDSPYVKQLNPHNYVIHHIIYGHWGPVTSYQYYGVK